MIHVIKGSELDCVLGEFFIPLPGYKECMGTLELP